MIYWKFWANHVDFIKIIFSDEVHFHFGGYVKKVNFYISGLENSHVVYTETNDTTCGAELMAANSLKLRTHHDNRS